jgi:hypothetical protein
MKRRKLISVLGASNGGRFYDYSASIDWPARDRQCCPDQPLNRRLMRPNQGVSDRHRDIGPDKPARAPINNDEGGATGRGCVSEGEDEGGRARAREAKRSFISG